MYLHRIHLDPHCREARRDLSDPYQMHATLCRVFSVPEKKCPGGQFLWRLEPETDPAGCPRILVQSRSIADWVKIGVRGWLAKEDPAIDLKARLKLDSLKTGRGFRFRLRANPCVTRNGKRIGLLQRDAQEEWIERKAKQHGFSLPSRASIHSAEPSRKRWNAIISQERMFQGNQHSGNTIRVFSVLYDGILIVTEPDQFRSALQTGIGHGKVLGLGLLSAVPIGQ